MDQSMLPPSINGGSIAAALLGNISNYQSYILGDSTFSSADVQESLFASNRLARLGTSPEVSQGIESIIAYGANPITAVPAYKAFMAQLYRTSPAPVHPVARQLEEGQEYPENLRVSRTYEGIKLLASTRLVSDIFPAVGGSQAIDARSAAAPVASQFSSRLVSAGLPQIKSTTEVITIPEGLPTAYRGSPYTVEALSIKDPLINTSKPITLLFVRSSDASLNPLYVGSIPNQDHQH
jgi:hypothetical protein